MGNIKNVWYFVVNPHAGSGKTMSEWVPAEKKLKKLGIQFETEFTSHKRHAVQLAFEAAQDGYRKIAAVGGDGSIHEVFSGICNYCEASGTAYEDFSIAVIPIGSGNDWIKSFGVPKDTEDAVECLAKGRFSPSDVVKAIGKEGKTNWMLNIGGTGFDSHVCERVNAQKEVGMRGKRIYLNSLLYTVSHTKAIPMNVIADGVQIYKGPCYSIAMGNGRYSGSGMRQVPLALPDDGLLDFMIVPKISIISIMKQIPRLFNGTINESPDIIYGRCKVLEILPLEEGQKKVFELDGEIEGELPARFEITGHTINVLTRR